MSDGGERSDVSRGRRWDLKGYGQKRMTVTSRK